MASRSKKIMQLINLKSVLPADPFNKENEAPVPDCLVDHSHSSLQDGSLDHDKSPIQDSPPNNSKEPMELLQDSSVQNSAVQVVMLSDITNNPENQSYMNVKTFFETEELAHQRSTSRKRNHVNYNATPVNSDESDVDVSDQDTTYVQQKKKVKPVMRRLSSSSSSSSSSSNSSSSSSSTSSSSDDSVNSTLTRQDLNTINNPISTSNNEQSIEVQRNSQIEDTEVSINTIEEGMEIGKKKGRKRNSNPTKWKQNINKVLRNTGRCYVSTKKKNVPPREVKQPCTERCRLRCSEKFTSNQRRALFDAYWNIGDVDKQRLFINSCMSNVTPRYKYTNAKRPRQNNKAFHFTIDEKPIQVCKPFFIGTLNISDRVIRTVKQKCDMLGVIQSDKRGKHNSHHTNDESLILDIKKFIDSIPRIESHYTRQTSTREYIDGAKTITDLFKDFKQCQEKNNKPYGKYCTFYKIFNKEYNISFFFPRKDQCDLCLQYENSNNDQKKLIQAKYEAHLEEKILSRQEKYNDRCNINDKNKVLVFDLQAVLQSPRGNTSAFYYKSKLNSYNFTVTLLNKKVDGQMKDAYADVHSYFWNETDAKRGANEIGSCLLDCFEKICLESSVSDGDGLNLILYSDNCTGQNKNKYIVALYLYAVTHLNIESITHKFLIKGHTQNEGDNIHSLIEKEIKKNLKSGPIYSPHQYIYIIKNAKKTGQKFLVHERTYDSILDLKKLQEDWGYNFSETEDKNNIAWNNIKILKCEKSEPFAFFVKTSYKDKEFEKICLRNKRKKMKPLSELIPVKAYTGKQELGENKKKDLKELVDKCLIPNFYKDFYDTIL